MSAQEQKQIGKIVLQEVMNWGQFQARLKTGNKLRVYHYSGKGSIYITKEHLGFVAGFFRPKKRFSIRIKDIESAVQVDVFKDRGIHWNPLGKRSVLDIRGTVSGQHIHVGILVSNPTQWIDQIKRLQGSW